MKSIVDYCARCNQPIWGIAYTAIPRKDKQEEEFALSPLCWECYHFVTTAPEKSASAQAGHPMYYTMLKEEAELHDRKNADYRSDGDPLANFKRVSAIMALYPKMDWSRPEAVAIVYSLKQLDAALSLLERQKEGGVETFDTRAQDISVYWRLARILHREAKK